MADNFARSPEHVVFQLVLFVEAEAHARLGFREQVEGVHGHNAGEFAFRSLIDKQVVVDHDVVRRGAIAEVVGVPGEFDKVRGGDRRIQIQGFDSRVLFPVHARAFEPVGRVMPLFRRLFSRDVHVAEVNLALDLSGIHRVLLFGLRYFFCSLQSHTSKTVARLRIQIDENIDSLSASLGIMWEKKTICLQRQCAVACFHGRSAAFGQSQPILAL